MMRWWLRMLKGESQADKPQSPLERYKTPYLPEFGWSEAAAEAEKKMIALVGDALDEQLAAFQQEYLAHIEAVTESNSVKEATPTEMAFSLGLLTEVAGTLSEAPQTILERVHAAFDNDGASTLNAYFQLYASSANYDALILERATALAEDLYNECYRRTEESYSSLTENESVLLRSLFYPARAKLAERCLSLYEHRWNVLVITLEHHNDENALAFCMEAWVRTATRLHSRALVNLFRETFQPVYLEMLGANQDNQMWALLRQKEAGRNFEPSLRASLLWDDSNEAHTSIIGHYIECWREFEDKKDEVKEVVTPKVLRAFDKHRKPLGDDYFSTIVESEVDDVYEGMWKPYFVDPTQARLNEC